MGGKDVRASFKKIINLFLIFLGEDKNHLNVGLLIIWKK